ncbi:MAG: ornithine carbamoyltransferase, partial [Clostridiales bacterium]|nr:ornithine carbamoyltransferase [Clostridiales bacterium]
MKHLINFNNLKVDDINDIIEKAMIIKNKPEKFSDVLKGKFLYELFQKTSTRTALSFSIGMEELGGKYFLQKW